MEESYVAYRQLPVSDERHPVYLGRHAGDGEHLFALLVVDGERVYDDVAGEEPVHAAQVDACAYAVLELCGQYHRHALLHSW